MIGIALLFLSDKLLASLLHLFDLFHPILVIFLFLVLFFLFDDLWQLFIVLGSQLLHIFLVDFCFLSLGKTIHQLIG